MLIDGELLARAAAKLVGHVLVDDRQEQAETMVKLLERAASSMLLTEPIKPVPNWQIMNQPPRSARRSNR